MVYLHSMCDCGWCSAPIVSGSHIACRGCMEKLERENAELEGQLKISNEHIAECEKEIERLKAEIDRLRPIALD